MNKINGVIPAVVTSVTDPDGEGKVQVSFPILPEFDEKPWAPVATLMSGNERGSYFMPEVDDEVLVAFDRGDFDHPYIVGFLWNGVDLPPDSDINPSVRRLRTVSGHTVEFDDNTGQERVLIITAGEHQIELKDAPPASITIKTKGGQEVKLNDTPAGVSIKTTSGNEINVTDAPPGINLKVPSGMVNVQCVQGSISCTAALNITAPMTVFSGVVQVPTLIAQAVVGSAYTPAPGDTYGL